MDQKDWRFEVLCAIRLSFKEGWSLEKLKERIDEIQKKTECIDKSSQCSEES